MSSRAWYADSIDSFLIRTPDEIVGILTRLSPHAVERPQTEAWLEQITILRETLASLDGLIRDRGKLYFEYDVPRMGRRIDVVAAIGHVLFVIEFKVGDREFTASATDQVWDYALDLKHFHETSHHQIIAPVLVATRAEHAACDVARSPHDDGLLKPIHATPSDLRHTIELVLDNCSGTPIDADVWERGRYSPTPTIIEAARALYGRHTVADLSRNDAGAVNLTRTSESIQDIIRQSRQHNRKSICFVTGVPGAGKTLVGLNVATAHRDEHDQLHSVFLSGNGPLVKILCEALARDSVEQANRHDKRLTLARARSEVKAFIQNVHHFRDEYIKDLRPPIDHVVLFDEAQRAWNLDRTSDFMWRKKGVVDFAQSEPQFLISCMDRHKDWAVVVCLVGGGQEINTGEAGISEWIESVLRSFPDWHIHISPRLHDSEYGAGAVLERIRKRPHVHLDEALHLGISMRSFRAERVSEFVKCVLDLDEVAARQLSDEIQPRYPIVLTRDLGRAKRWLRHSARGSERYGIVVSSQAERLKPHAINVRSPMDPVHWFLAPKQDVRSSYYLEDVATEFHVQGLELDWAAVVWDGDFRRSPAHGWTHHSFVGERWNRINKAERQQYLKNAYRVLLTRARQGMVIVVPEGDVEDPTRSPDIYDPTFEYLAELGLPQLAQ